jgi:putative PEP-CTERM system histidine kinase
LDVVVDLGLISFGLAALMYTLLGINAGRSGSFSRPFAFPHFAFGAAVVASAAWAYAGMLTCWRAGVASEALLGAADLLRYGLWFWLLLLLVPHRSAGAREAGGIALRHVAAVIVFFGGLSMAAGLIWTRPDVARLSFFGQLALPVFGLVLLEQLFRNVPEDFRWHAKPLCIAIGCIFLFDVYVYSQAVLLGRAEGGSVAIRGAMHAFAVPLLYLASKRRSEWLARLHVSRTAAFHTATLFLVGVYLLFVSAAGYYVRDYGGDWGTALQTALVFAALLWLAVLAFSGAARARVRVFIGKHFFSYRYDYRAEWLRFTAMLSGNSSPREMGGLVIRGLANMLQSPGGALWTASHGSAEFMQSAHWNFPATAAKEPTGSAFSTYVARKAWIVDLAEYRQHPERYEGVSIPPWLLELRQAWLVVPLMVLDELIGFVVLSEPHAATDVNWEVRDLLKTASRQAASYLAQMNATEALLEVRKFDAFNRMSAFVVHDLKNIVTQLSLMMQNARRLQNNPEFRQDMLTTVENSLEKMRQLIQQLREGETPVGVKCGVELSPIVQRIQAMSAARGRSLEVKICDAVTANGHEERLARVLGHLVQNAFEAVPADGRVWMTLQRADQHAEIIVGDNGHGMSQEFVRTRLFKPFHTTKQNGMGIGAYESYQYVRELGGAIDVESEVDRGTVISVKLPLFETSQTSGMSAITAK